MNAKYAQLGIRLMLLEPHVSRAQHQLQHGLHQFKFGLHQPQFTHQLQLKLCRPQHQFTHQLQLQSRLYRLQHQFTHQLQLQFNICRHQNQFTHQLQFNICRHQNQLLHHPLSHHHRTCQPRVTAIQVQLPQATQLQLMHMVDTVDTHQRTIPILMEAMVLVPKADTTTTEIGDQICGVAES